MFGNAETTTSSFTGSDGRSHSIYGPSSMETYLRCPRLWHYSTTYEPTVALWDPRPVIGTLMHKAIARAMTMVPPATAWDDGMLAGSLPQEQLDGLLSDLSQIWEPNPFLEVSAGQALLAKAIKTSLASLDILVKGKTVEAYEAPCGRGTVDLVLRGPAGLEIWDHKWHEKLDPKWAEREFRKTETTVQLWEYALGWMEAHEEPPVLIGKHIISGSPNKAWRVGVAVHPNRMAEWKRSSEQWHVEAVRDANVFTIYEQRPKMNLSSCWDYGQCSFFGVCHNPDGNQTPPETLFRLKAS